MGRKQDIEEDDLDLEEQSHTREDDSEDDGEFDEEEVLEMVADAFEDACDDQLSIETERDHVIVELNDNSRWKITVRKLT